MNRRLEDDLPDGTWQAHELAEVLLARLPPARAAELRLGGSAMVVVEDLAAERARHAVSQRLVETLTVPRWHVVLTVLGEDGRPQRMSLGTADSTRTLTMVSSAARWLGWAEYETLRKFFEYQQRPEVMAAAERTDHLLRLTEHGVIRAEELIALMGLRK